jgi:hypothetical protein
MKLAIVAGLIALLSTAAFAQRGRDLITGGGQGRTY